MAGQGSPAWQRRNARARALGYSSYYDYRAHNYGRRPASEPRSRGSELARLRGHRGPGDLGRRLRGGDVELMNVIQTSADPPEMEVLVTRSDGSTETYTVRGRRKIDELNRQIKQLGPQGPQIVGSPAQRRTAQAIEAAVAEEELAAEAAAYEEEIAELAEERGISEEEAAAELADQAALEHDEDDGIPF